MMSEEEEEEEERRRRRNNDDDADDDDDSQRSRSPSRVTESTERSASFNFDMSNRVSLKKKNTYMIFFNLFIFFFLYIFLFV